MLTLDILLFTTIMLRIGAEVDGYDSKTSGCKHQLKQNFHGDDMYDFHVVARAMKRQLVVLILLSGLWSL